MTQQFHLRENLLAKIQIAQRELLLARNKLVKLSNFAVFMIRPHKPLVAGYSSASILIRIATFNIIFSTAALSFFLSY